MLAALQDKTKASGQQNVFKMILVPLSFVDSTSLTVWAVRDIEIF